MEILSLEELDALLDRLESGFPSRAEIDRVLTDGYAEALQLEADCLRYKRQIGDASGGGADRLRRELSETSAQLAQLRMRLDAASRRLGRNPLSDPIR